MDFSVKKREILLFLLVFSIFIIVANVLATNPVGYLDSASTTSVYGWACDVDQPETQIKVHLYFGGPAGSGAPMREVTANEASEAAVNEQCRGGTAHRFTFTPTQDLINSLGVGTHYIYAYGINVGEGGNNQISASPKPIDLGTITGYCPGGCSCYNDQYCYEEWWDGGCTTSRGAACYLGYKCVNGKCIRSGITGICPGDCTCSDANSCRAYSCYEGEYGGEICSCSNEYSVDCYSGYECKDVDRRGECYNPQSGGQVIGPFGSGTEEDPFIVTELKYDVRFASQGSGEEVGPHIMMDGDVIGYTGGGGTIFSADNLDLSEGQHTVRLYSNYWDNDGCCEPPRCDAVVAVLRIGSNDDGNVLYTDNSWNGFYQNYKLTGGGCEMGAWSNPRRINLPWTDNEECINSKPCGNCCLIEVFKTFHVSKFEPAIEILPEHTIINEVDLNTLIRLYGPTRNITIPFKIKNTGDDKVRIKAEMDCSTPFPDLKCSLIKGSEGYDLIEPGEEKTFRFTANLSKIPPPSINVLKQPLNLDVTVTYSHPTYPERLSYTETGTLSVTLVDQDWSQVFCEAPNDQATGILQNTEGSLQQHTWLRDDILGFSSLETYSSDQGYKTCCGDDLKESWSNPSNINMACYNNGTLISCDISKDNNRVVNDNGDLFLCNADVDDLTGQTLTKAEYCDLKCDYWFCAYNTSEWYNTEGRGRGYQRSWIDTTVAYPTECCGQTQCWNTSECVDDTSGEYINPEIYEGYRCINGEWKEAKIVCEPDDTKCGFCPEDGQCLYDLGGNADYNNIPDDMPYGEKPKCIADGQYIDDHYCENTNWTSRTKQVALQLLSLPQSNEDYVLFCSNFEEVLNFLGYIVKDYKPAGEYAAETNNYCVLNYSGKVLFGTSLNREIDEAEYGHPFIDVIDPDNSCTPQSSDEGIYYQCSTGYAWYDKTLKSVIYSKNPITPSAINPSSKAEWLKSLFSGLIDKFKTITPFDESFKKVKKFRELYLNKKDNKIVAGTFEGRALSAEYKNIVIKYENFNTNICGIVNIYNQLHSDTGSGIFCIKEGNKYYILAQGDYPNTNLDPEKIWPDLTGTLRVS